MSKSEKLENYKKEIRSILITYPKGCYLSELIRAYRDLIGRRLPSGELGFKTDVEFLYTIPDVVRINPSGTGDYHLQGIADDKSKHIQKMVCRQKSAKMKPPAFIRSSRSYERYVMPPRLYENTARSVKVFEHQPSPVKKPLLLSTPTPVAKPVMSPKEQIISLVKHFKSGIALTDLLYEYEKLYHTSFSLSKYDFSSLEECIENIAELKLVQKCTGTFVVHQPDSSNSNEANQFQSVQNTSKISSGTKNLQNNVEVPKEIASASTLNHSRSSNCDNGNVPSLMISKLQKVAKKYPDGIWACDFPSYFEEVTVTTFDLHALGYKSLSDFIDDVPDIFIRKSVAGNKKDFIIYAADEFSSNINDSHQKVNVSFPQVGVLLIDHIILNIRKILEAYSEGIVLPEFLHVYSINCKDSLRVQDLGFGDLETFLSNIKERVPLRFEYINGVKTIFLLKLSEFPTNIPAMSSDVCEQEAIPFDAVFPDFKFDVQPLPPLFDFSKYIPVYASSIANPGHLYIQLQGEETAEALMNLADDLEKFYHGSQSKFYTMKNAHIKVGSTCVSLWPADEHWYRAEILSIPSMETVKVNYIDYGTTATIPKSLLRYLRKEYTELPAQAIRCRLAFLKPLNDATEWDPKSKDLLLELCEDVPLMAKIEEVTDDGIFSIVLCDTNDKTDVFMNDVLRNKKLAEFIEDPNKSISIPSPVPSPVQLPAVQMDYYSISTLQALQAQYFLHAFAAVAPPFAQHESYIKLLQHVSVYCKNSDPMLQNSSQLYNPAFSAANSSLFPTDVSTSTSANCSSTYPAAVSALDTSMFPSNSFSPQNMNSLPPPVSAVDHYIRPPTPSDSFVSAKSCVSSLEKNYESEIFEEDDDEMFQQFCQNLSLKTVRFVERVILGDGYKIHIIVVESEPFASCGDISQLIWNNQEVDYLFRRLQLKESDDLSPVTLSEDGNKELFSQLQRYNVKGVRKATGFKSSILLYPLKVVIRILNLFGHPSISLRMKLTEEITQFNIDDPKWKEFSVPENEPEEEDYHGVTDDDKIERFCLSDLLAMKEGIKHRRSKMMNFLNDSDNSKYVDEIEKLEQMQQKVLQRIAEIKEICDAFK